MSKTTKEHKVQARVTTAQINYLSQLQEEKGFKTVTQALNYLINYAVIHGIK